MPALLPDSAENIDAAKAFVMKKWIERYRERNGPNSTMPSDLSDSCKFTSMFAQEVFGGTLEGNSFHQFLRTNDGKIIDLNSEARDVIELGVSAHKHDKAFWGSRGHRASLSSVAPRVADWVAEFMQDIQIS